jgi:hypothetical protein
VQRLCLPAGPSSPASRAGCRLAHVQVVHPVTLNPSAQFFQRHTLCCNRHALDVGRGSRFRWLLKGVELLLWMLMVVLDGHDDRAFHHSSHTIQ